MLYERCGRGLPGKGAGDYPGCSQHGEGGQAFRGKGRGRGEAKKPLIFAVGNAPTALAALYGLIQKGRLAPALIIAVPVGFVNVVPAKEQILGLADYTYIYWQEGREQCGGGHLQRPFVWDEKITRRNK